MSPKKRAMSAALALLAGIFVVSNLPFPAASAAGEHVTKVGFLIPSQCQPREGGARPEGPYDEWPAPHTTECALAEACIASGYGLWVMEEKA